MDKNIIADIIRRLENPHLKPEETFHELQSLDFALQPCTPDILDGVDAHRLARTLLDIAGDKIGFPMLQRAALEAAALVALKAPDILTDFFREDLIHTVQCNPDISSNTYAKRIMMAVLRQKIADPQQPQRPAAPPSRQSDVLGSGSVRRAFKALPSLSKLFS